MGRNSYSLAITLMSMILASGMGSFTSEAISRRRPELQRWLPACAAVLVAIAAFTVRHAIDLAMSASLPLRSAAVILFTFPVGFVLGWFFPLGMERLRIQNSAARSWMWGLNGAFGVLGSLASIMIAMSFGVRVCLLVGAACYLVLSLPAYVLAADASSVEPARTR